MSVLRCCSRALQCGRDGSVSEVHEEKILCPKGTASALALLCWRREVLRLGRCPGCSSVVGRQRKPRSALCVCVCNTDCHWFAITLKMFSSPVCLQWLLPATSSVLSSTLSALAHAAFLLCLVQTWLYSFGLPFPLFPCWMEAAEATKISSLLSRKDIQWKHL